MQTLGLAQDGARMLQQRAAGLRRRHPLAAAGEQRHAEHVLHIADAGRGRGQREMGALGAVGDAAGFDDMAKQAEIGQIETHGKQAAFGLREARLHIMPIVLAYINAILSWNAKLQQSNGPVRMQCCIAARRWIE